MNWLRCKECASLTSNQKGFSTVADFGESGIFETIDFALKPLWNDFNIWFLTWSFDQLKWIVTG